MSRAVGKVVGFFDSVGKVVGAVAGVLALAGALGVVSLAGGGDSDTKDPAGEKRADVTFSADELQRITNERFAFSLSHPKTWERQDAFNTDGSVLRSPDESAELRAYGVYVSDGPTDVLSRVDYLAARQKQSVLEADGQILSDDVRFVAWDGPSADRTPAARVVYRSRDLDNGRPVTGISMLTTQEGRDVTISCEVSRARFREFEGACNQLISTLKLERLE